jgi:hypothetical protein
MECGCGSSTWPLNLAHPVLMHAVTAWWNSPGAVKFQVDVREDHLLLAMGPRRQRGGRNADSE